MKNLIEGIRRFRTRVFPERRDLFATLARGQNASAMMICCADSRVDMQLVTQCEPGQLFFCRNAGNLVPPHGSAGATAATIEYAMEALQIANIIVCGHSDCGAMRAVLDPVKVAQMPTVASWLRFADTPRKIVARELRTSPHEQLTRLIELNVLTQLEHLKTHPSVAARLAAGSVRLHGWVYDIEQGSVCGYDHAAKAFHPLVERVSYAPATPVHYHNEGVCL
jgi:carbonic anhydrase